MLKKIIVGIVVVGLIGVALGWKHVSAFLNGRKGSANQKTILVPIDNKKSLNQIVEFLIQKKIVDDKDAFLSLANYKGLTNQKIGSGMYRIAPGTSYRMLLNGFTLNSNGNGNAEIEVPVTFNNCATIDEMCEKVSNSLLIDKNDLKNYILSSNTLSKYGFLEEQAPALFIPNTYNMYYDATIEQFVERMAQEFKNFWTSDRMNKLKKVGLKSPSEAVTLASVVYGEQAKKTEEWPIIAGLYLNRLNKNMRLQSDPTFKFCWPDQLKGVQRLTFEHREKDCPYNTYLHNGLPPGPISLPPSAVVDAVLNRDNNNFIFMCAQPNFDGLHDFSIDYATHQAYANKYQAWLNTLDK